MKTAAISKRISNRRQSRSHQRGAAQLFITLVLLGVIMMLGITATIISSTQFKLAGNLQFESQAMDNAETAAAAALSWLSTGCNGQQFVGTASGSKRASPLNGVTEVDPFNVDWSSDGQTVSNDASRRYIVQARGSTNLGQLNEGAGSSSGGSGGAPYADQAGQLFRISGRGVSAKGTTRVVQSNVYIQNQKKCD